MASSMLPGDRRWGQTRKSGMTVLGKVPKPINLPSQRLENLGLDPNVEIVPKGTHTWGSRRSLTTPSAWGSSALSSPNAVGSSGSPSCLSGRPSSVGSFPRSSTAGCDQSHQAVSNAWDPNSQPLSASGILPSHQTLVLAARPHSAETKPGSFQLSEPVAESSAWRATRLAEKLGAASKFNSCTLDPGDFPTLGSEKNSNTNGVQQGHNSLGHPASASGTVAVQKETMILSSTGNGAANQCLDKGNVNTWKRNNVPYSDSSFPLNSDNWHRDPLQMQSYLNASVLPQQLNTQIGPPIQSSTDAVWYRGGPPGCLYRPGGPPGCYPIESYIYYPQLPDRPLSDTQPGPRHGSVLGGYDPKNGQPRHPPDPYMMTNHPVGSVRPGVNPCQVHHDRYYGPPPPSLGNVKEWDGPVLGMASCPSLYSQFPNQNQNMDPGNFHALPCHYASPVRTEQVESGHACDSHGRQYKVLLKQHDGCKDNESEENKDLSVTASMAEIEGKDRLGASKLAQRSGKKDEPAKMRFNDGLTSQFVKGLEVHSSIPTVKKNASISMEFEIIGDKCTNTASQAEDPQKYVVKKNATLIEKIEDLNNKARPADGRCVNPASSGEEMKRQSENVIIKAVPSKLAQTSAILSEKSSEDISFGCNFSDEVNTGETSLESTVDDKVQLRASEMHSSAVGLLGSPEVGLTADSYCPRKVHNMQNRADYIIRSRFDSQEGELWRRKSLGKDSLTINNIESFAEVRMQDCRPTQDVPEKKELHHMAKVGDEPFHLSLMEPVDYNAQHVKMIEKATQRAKQLQKEEEERTREQKARALAKLEELNRRALVESSNQTLHHATVPSNQAQPRQDARTCPDARVNSMDSDAPGSVSGPNSDFVVQTNGDNVDTLEVPVASRTNEGAIILEQSIDSSSNAVALPIIHHETSVTLMQGIISTEDAVPKTSSQFHDSSLFKQTLMPHKRRQNNLEEKCVFEKNVSVGVVAGLKSLGDSVPTRMSSADVILSHSKDVVESSIQHKKRNNRSMRNKSTSDEAPPFTTLQSLRKVENLEKVLNECGKSKPSGLVMEEVPVLCLTPSRVVGAQISTDVVTVSPGQGLSQGSKEDAPSKAMEQWKPNHSRRITRNPQATKLMDKSHRAEAVVWAPVRPTNQKEPSEEVQSTTNKANFDPSSKIGNDAQLSLKSKRVEMERYVPKPIAKELSLQGNLQQPSFPSLTASALNVEFGSRGTTESGPDDSVTVKVELPAETNYGQSNKANRHGRTHTSWRQHGPTESSPNLLDSLEASSADSPQNNQKYFHLWHLSEHDNSLKEQTKYSDDGWNDRNYYLMQSELTKAPTVVKDNASVNRGRRQPFKGYKVVGNNYSARNKESGIERTDKTDSQTLAIQTNESAGSYGVRNENPSMRNHPGSRWQPKSQAYSIHSEHQGSWSSGEQEIASQRNIFDKISSLPEGGSHGQPIESSSALTKVTVSAGIRTAKQHEGKRGKKVVEDSNGQSHNSNHDQPPVAEQGIGPQQEPFLAGPRQHGLRGGQSNRGHESNFGRVHGLRQENAKCIQPSNVDRQKHNSRYEYQRVGYNRQSDSSQHKSLAGEEAHDCSNSRGKYREWSQNCSGHGGNFYSRASTATAQAGSAYGSGE